MTLQYFNTSRGRQPGDLLIHVESLEYCTKTQILRNGTGTAREFTDVLGYPVIAGDNGADKNLAVAGQEASVIGLVIDGPTGQDTETIAANTNSELPWQVLVNAPAILNRNQIRAQDIAGADFDVDAIVTALEALGFEIRDVPVNRTVL